MDTSFINDAALLAAGAVVLVQQILKLKLIPLSFANKYPVPTNIVLSILATVAIVRPDVDVDNLGHFATQVLTIAVAAAVTYNQLLSRWAELKESEG